MLQLEIEIDDGQQNNDLESIKNPLGDGQNELMDVESETGCNTSDEYEPSEISDNDSGCDDEKTLSEIKSKIVEKKTAKGKTLTKSKKKVVTAKKKRNGHRLDPIKTEEMIRKHIPMACQLCIYVGKTFADIVEHFKNHHPKARPHIICCDKKFTRSYVIAQHAIIHENPNSWR